MNIDKKQYKKYAAAHAPRSPILRDSLRAFWVGGLICAIGQGLMDLYEKVLGACPDHAAAWASITLVALSVTLTALGWFDRIARFAGAGTLVPITGFANAVASPAIDSHAEGLVLGIGAKIFTVAGPVLLYGTLAGTVFGILYYLWELLGSAA